MKLFILLLIIILIYMYFDSSEHFVPFDVLTDYNDIYDLNVLIKKVIPIFHHNNFEYWMCGGTALGAIRDKGIIHWDDDADFCIMDSKINELLQMEKEFLKLDLGIVEWFGGYKIYDKKGKEIKNKNFKYPFIDLFIMTKKNDKIILKDITARELWPDEYYIPNELYPLKLYDFEDYQIYGANQIIPYLDRSYSGWRNKANKTYDHVVHKNVTSDWFPIEYLTEKPYLWHNSNNSIDKYYKSFNIIKIDENNIHKYLPEISEHQEKIKNLSIKQKTDIYKIMLLYKYGGIYLDSSVKVAHDLTEIIDKLKSYDFIGFNCKEYGEPDDTILCSRPTSFLMAKILKNQLNQLYNNTKIGDLGKSIIWKELKNLIKNHKYKYYQMIL